MIRNRGHERATRVDRPDSVTDPLEQLESELLTRWEKVVLFFGIGLAGVFGLMVGHGYYIWFLKP